MYSFKEVHEGVKCVEMSKMVQIGTSKTKGLKKWVWYPLSGPSSKVYIYITASALVAALVYQVQVVCTSAEKSQPSVLLVFLYKRWHTCHNH